MARCFRCVASSFQEAGRLSILIHMPPKRKDSGEELQAEIRKAAEDGANADDVGGDAADAELAAKRRLLAATRRKLRPRQTQIKVPQEL